MDVLPLVLAGLALFVVVRVLLLIRTTAQQRADLRGAQPAVASSAPLPAVAHTPPQPAAVSSAPLPARAPAPPLPAGLIPGQRTAASHRAPAAHRAPERLRASA